MKKTNNLGLTLYEGTDKFAITASENSLNHNMELIDSAIKDMILVEAGGGINSLQQKPDSSSWTPLNSKVSEYITNNTVTADGPAITTDDNGKALVGAYGKNSTMMNAKSQTVGGRSHAEGSKTIAFENNSHAEGNETFAAGKHSHAEGNTTSAIGQAAHSEGRETLANGDFCHAEGYKTTAQGISNHAEGFLATAYGDSNHAEGQHTVAGTMNTGTWEDDTVQYVTVGAHAEGFYTEATGWAAHAEGEYTNATGKCAHAEGGNTSALHDYSHVSGVGTISTRDYQTVVGSYNRIDIEDSIFVVGNGEDEFMDGVRSNAFEVKNDGSAEVKIQGIKETSVVQKQYVDGLIEKLKTAIIALGGTVEE